MTKCLNLVKSFSVTSELVDYSGIKLLFCPEALVTEVRLCPLYSTAVDLCMWCFDWHNNHVFKPW